MTIIVRVWDADLSPICQFDTVEELNGPHLDLQPLGRYVLNTPEEQLLRVIATVDEDGTRQYKRLAEFDSCTCQCGRSVVTLTWNALV